MTDPQDKSLDRRDGPKGNPRSGEPVDAELSKVLDFLARQLHSTEQTAGARKQFEQLSSGMGHLLVGEYGSGATLIEKAATSLLQYSSLDRETNSFLKKCLKELVDSHLRHNNPVGALRSLDMLIELAGKQDGDRRGDIATLSFERVLALKVIRERQGARNEDFESAYLSAIQDTRRMTLQTECGLTTTTRGHILVTLGKSLFYAGSWDEAKYTLSQGLQYVVNADVKAASLTMLAQISHYQGDSEEARQYLREIRNSRIVLPPELEAVAEDIVAEYPESGETNDPPTLVCIKKTLQRGYALLEAERLPAAQSTFEEGLTMIEHQYGRNHYLASTALTLLCKTLADRGSHSKDRDERTTLFTEARISALRAFDILKNQDADRPRQKQLLEYARDISEALGDEIEASRISAMLKSNLF